MNTVTAVGAVDFRGSGFHVTYLSACITVITVGGFKILEYGELSEDLQTTAGRTEIAAPKIGDQNSKDQGCEDNNCPGQPQSIGVFKGQTHGFKKLTRSDGNGPPGIDRYKDEIDANGLIIGSRGNIKPSNFFIPGLSQTNQQKLTQSNRITFVGLSFSLSLVLVFLTN